LNMALPWAILYLATEHKEAPHRTVAANRDFSEARTDIQHPAVQYP
jgi:hypothetical protein